VLDEPLKQVLSAVFEIPEGEIDDGTIPENVALWDSLNHLRMISEIEKAFRIRLTVKEIRAMRSYRSIREIVGNHMHGTAG
jgi:acyl carrier protein